MNIVRFKIPFHALVFLISGTGILYSQPTHLVDVAKNLNKPPIREAAHKINGNADIAAQVRNNNNVSPNTGTGSSNAGGVGVGRNSAPAQVTAQDDGLAAFPVLATDSDSAALSVSPLLITKTSDATGPVNHGDTITYTIKVENLGAGTVSGVDVQDLLPAGVTYVPGTVSASLFPTAGAGGTFTQEITTAGSGTFTVPTGVTQLRVEAWGGGGSGAASTTGNTGGGGGGGAYARLNAFLVTPGAILNYSVGAGGGLPGVGNPGNPGLSSWFSNTTTLLALGGTGAEIPTGGAGGSASGSIGNQTYPGGNGGGGTTGSNPDLRVGGGGGGSAFENGPGGAGGNGLPGIPGPGGIGKGNGGNGGQASSAIRAQGGFAPGGGGGGCGGAGAGAGAMGKIIITYNVPALAGTAGSPPSLASGWTLEAGATLTVTFKATLDTNAFLTDITNIASVTSNDDPEPRFASVADLVNAATVGNFVWLDLNGNGIQDAGEPGLNGVTVQLLAGGDVLATTVTADNGSGNPGSYQFIGVPPGDYSVRFILPSGHVFSPQNADREGLDGTLNSDASSTGITPTFTLTSGQTNANVDAGLYKQAGPDLWTAWQTKWSDELGTETGFTDNPDGDRYDNLIEYAFCLPPNSGVGKPFWLVASGLAGKVDGVFSRTAGGPQDVTFYLEWASALTVPTIWSAGLPLHSGNTTVTYSGDGREIVSIVDLETLTGLTGGSGFVRIRVEMVDIQTASAATEVHGWVETALLGYRTYNNPFLQSPAFAGTVEEVDGQTLAMTNSAEPLVPGVDYYIEVISGDNEGERFDVASVGFNRITLASDTDLYVAAPPFNTLTGSLPADLAGDLIVLRRHWTLDQLFPPESFTKGAQETSDQVQVFAGGAWAIYWLYEGEDAQSPRWVKNGEADMTNSGGAVIQPGQGMFVNKRGAGVDLLAYGEVRDNAFIRPLAAGMNLVGGGYPVDQKARGSRSRGLEQGASGIGFFGSLDFKTADSFFVWRGDAAPGVSTYDTYWLLNRPSTGMISWVKVGEVTGVDRGVLDLFARNRSVFQRAASALPAYGYPAPWAP